MNNILIIYYIIFLTLLSGCGGATNNKLTEAEKTNQTINQTYNCGNKYFCSQMNSCDEAMFYHEACNLGELDRDKDGIPCENICL